MDLGLRDKVAIITGGSDGIGKAAALSMAQEGASVVIVARRPDVLEEAVQDIKAATEGQVTPISADVTDPDTARSIVERTLNPVRAAGHPGQQRRDLHGQAFRGRVQG